MHNIVASIDERLQQARVDSAARTANRGQFSDYPLLLRLSSERTSRFSQGRQPFSHRHRSRPPQEFEFGVVEQLATVGRL